jgi:hypothetical protein
MADINDSILNFDQGPATVQITPYDSAGDLEADSVIITYAKDGVSLTLTQSHRDRTADSCLVKINKVLQGLEGKGSAIIQDMDAELLAEFTGADVVIDSIDSTKKRATISTTSDLQMPYGANVKIIGINNTDYVVELVKAAVFVSTLTLDFAMTKDRLYQVDFELLMPNSGTDLIKIGSTSAA